MPLTELELWVARDPLGGWLWRMTMTPESGSSREVASGSKPTRRSAIREVRRRYDQIVFEPVWEKVDRT